MIQQQSKAPAIHRILVADDEVYIRELLVDILETTPHQVDVAQDGQDAFEKWSQLSYDLLILDLRMPRMDGETLIQAIRESDQRTAIIVLTGHGELSQAYALLRAYHISDFLHKPLEHPSQLLFSVENVLDKRRLQQQTEYYAEQLAAMNEQLRALNQRLEGASRQKSDFIANISHELRTPLNAVIGFLALALKKLEPALSPGDLNEIRKADQAAHTLMQLIRDVLDFSKIESGEMDTIVEDVDIELLIEETAITAEGLLEDKPLELRCDIADNLPHVESDYVKLKQILNNLVGNAIKFTDAGTITVRATLSDADSGIVIDVQDTGQGIPPDMQDRIFESFKQLDGSIKKKFKGTGLGLAISKHLCDTLGIGITFRSDVGTGTTFQLTIPPSYVPSAAATAESEPMKAALLCACQPDSFTMLEQSVGGPLVDLLRIETLSQYLAQNQPVLGILIEPGLLPEPDVQELRQTAIFQHIPLIEFSASSLPAAIQAVGAPYEHTALIVDDNPMNLELMSELLHVVDYTVDTAKSGRLAIERARALKPNVIVMDLAMPEMDGFETTEQLRQYEETRHIPVIACSAFAIREHQEKAFHIGCAGFITKPVDPEHFAEQVSHVATIIRLWNILRNIPKEKPSAAKNAKEREGKEV